jgi:DNA-binding MarR family transcriptional regulator
VSTETPIQPAGVQWLDELEMETWLSILGFSTRLMTKLDDELRAAHGLSLPDYEVLSYLSEAPGRRMRMSELAVHLRLSPSGLTRRLDGLVKAGLVARETCDSDRRGTNAVLTERGWELLQRAAPDHVASVRRHLVDRLSRRQLQQLVSALRALRPACEE